MRWVHTGLVADLACRMTLQEMALQVTQMIITDVVREMREWNTHFSCRSEATSPLSPIHPSKLTSAKKSRAGATRSVSCPVSPHVNRRPRTHGKSNSMSHVRFDDADCL
eukprot:m.60092 g.60092  ORF g.60092 m.60092 type:complete len:109 (+) comp7257_c0_seq2:1590-1916(+)